MKKIVFTIFLCLATLAVEAQVDKILGPWTAIDPDTDKPYATVLIYKSSNGLYYGKLTEILDSDDPADQKLIGTIIIKDMKEDDGMLKGGSIYDPEENKTYHGKISLTKDGRLEMRGSLDRWGLLGATEYWKRSKK
ncbi:MAG: DUF2147 domain-containing protein [Fibrobacter sp.]|jgi:hypothetical protein|uniref:DUF2147 domain-containing protein n=1 Tax=Fibrobacter TaxID=832 RepID=UPI000B5239D3|nr:MULTISPECIES: DUF2147 domain-containing protein [Fibrobacter]MBR4681212.1 DUF2147 domain-containing protein [Fibrobacter sp.]OWV11820.1 hypothetical protein B7989_09320 [Fibrobacter sp. UWB5]SMP45487.1 hypothetical protein SAMN05720465_1072 [Fibrobacter sp. UWB10]